MKEYNRIRLALALGFQLGAIAVIRTALNFFLNKEMQEERRDAKAENETESRSPATAAIPVIRNSGFKRQE